MSEHDFLCFTRTKVKGKRCYGCRGTGPRYQAFYDWTRTHTYKCVHDDWPWDYFIILSHHDEADFLDKYTSDFLPN
jgi:hypothetical protein